jgi:UDP-N-acetylglucosamine transferase subunit ALG13
VIFATVGGQVPFDRLIRAIDAWSAHNENVSIYAQIGDGAYVPTHIDHCKSMSPAEFQDRVRKASLVVAHAGMGTILTSLQLGVPILVMPRNASLGEHRNDHQLATARILEKHGLLSVVMNEDELFGRLDIADDLPAPPRISAVASDGLLNELRKFVAEIANAR